MRVTEQGRLVYLDPPKTGNKTIITQLEGNFQDVRKVIEWEPKWESYFIFISVRSPFTRAIRLWQHACEDWLGRDTTWQQYLRYGKVSFENLLFHAEPEVQAWWESTACVNFIKDLPRIDLVVPQEQRRTFMSQVPSFKWHVMLRQRVVVDQNPWYEHYNDRCIKRIQELYEEDFNTFEYRFNFDKTKLGVFRK